MHEFSYLLIGWTGAHAGALEAHGDSGIPCYMFSVSMLRQIMCDVMVDESLFRLSTDSAQVLDYLCLERRKASI